ncbi:MAG: GNAT family N-acetyltransferase [Burkholderiaceae bacterium]|nr:MAG: GNAT family N-acetyltransferase [Burkholderiaceae bacterium]
MKTVLAPESLDIAGKRLILRDITPDDQREVLALHHQVFGSSVDARWFDWKYVTGQGEGVGLWSGESLVAFCGGTPREVLDKGVSKRFLQIGDVMVSPEWRGVFGRKNPFFYVSERLYRTRLGGEGDFRAGFGFPNQRHLRLAVKTGLSHDAGEVGGLQWLLDRSNPPALSNWRWRSEPLDPGQRSFDRAVDRCWQRMRTGCTDGWVGVRDANYVRWRFIDRPDKHYRFLALRRPWRSEPEGLAVLALPVAASEALPWLDWVGPKDLLHEAWAIGMQQACRDGSAGLTTWASPAMADLLARTRPTRMGTAAGVGVPTASALTTAEIGALNAWWTGGDTDFL